MVGILLITVLAVAVALAFVLRSRGIDGGSAQGIARALSYAAALVAVVTAVGVAPGLLDDGNPPLFNVLALAVPVLAAVGPAAAPAGRMTAAITWTGALAMLAYVVVLGLGVGFYFTPAALLLLAAAVAENGARRRPQPEQAGGRDRR